MHLEQFPAPGQSLLRHSGDDVVFTLRVEGAGPGRAILRTSLGGARRRRRELIEAMDAGRPALALDWNDVPMEELPREGRTRRYAVRLPLVDIGSFHAKCCFLPEGDGKIQWPDGADVLVKVAPAWTVRWSSIYCAFPRQFGPNLERERSDADSGDVLALERQGYSVIPQAGTFRSLARHLDTILGEERFRILQLLPIHPVPTTYARMGRFGSPFAGTDFLSVNPSLAEFDTSATPLEQFRELVDAVHTRGARLFIDLPANHTGWASTLQTHHPEWFRRNADGSYASPGAWGIVWEDLVELDYSHPELRAFMASVFEFWCQQGVDGFRCDAGYMVPAEVWRYIVARVREQYPDTVFLLEGLGGKISVTRDLIAEQGLDWAYSEIFQTEDRSAFERYLTDAETMSAEVGPLAHYAETHDNNRLASRSHAYARMRTALAALASRQGCFGITNGVEWFADEKVDVHRASALRWGAADNQVAAIRRLNTIVATLPAFAAGASLRMVQQGPGNSLALLRVSADGAERALVLVNLDPDHDQPVAWPGRDFDTDSCFRLFDTHDENPGEGRLNLSAPSMNLGPGQALCLVRSPEEIREVEAALRSDGRSFVPDAIRRQELRMAALRLRRVLTKGKPLGLDENVEELADLLASDPIAAVRRFLPDGAYPPVTPCDFPEDTRRIVPLPWGNFLLIRAPHPFRARLQYEAAGRTIRKTAISFQLDDGSHAAFIDHPASNAASPFRAAVNLEVAEPGRPVRDTVTLEVLPRAEGPIPLVFTGEEVRRGDYVGLLANGRGAMARVRARWGEVRSQYDAILAANPDPKVPCDRWILFPRCRAWLVNHGFSSEVDASCLRTFEATPSRIRWDFAVPVGTGRTVPLRIALTLARGANRSVLTFSRLDDGTEEAVELILRPDVESRSFHNKTKAFAGAENAYPAAVSALADGFVFRPAGSVPLELRAPGARFVHESEWHYMVGHPVEAGRGQDGSTDLFSPGWFSFALAGGGSLEMTASIPGEAPSPVEATPDPRAEKNADNMAGILRDALQAFVVKREDFSTVIAGYPWFLDWGRDTFISMRGMIAAGLTDESLEIVRTFGAFEKDGTLPNMICGADASNRDTSDAQLWYCVAVSDLCHALGKKKVLQLACGDRTVADVVLSICRGYVNGTPNGIRMDPDSALVHSPSHFTWMDTNFPAGTPRKGYPVEIQALWIAALSFAAKIEPSGPWADLAKQARASLAKYFFLPERGFLSDCLHCEHGYRPAAEAVADDHLRCNQLFAVTLGAIDDPAIARAVVASSERLLVPGAIRTLAPGRVRYELPIDGPCGRLNDPAMPYWGRYEGDEDTRRKPAYHNGTAWPWPFPSYPEALVKVYGESALPAARSLLLTAVPLLRSDCLGHLPEIMDGDAPHTGRGCDAQAWSVSEFLRVALALAK